MQYDRRSSPVRRRLRQSEKTTIKKESRGCKSLATQWLTQRAGSLKRRRSRAVTGFRQSLRSATCRRGLVRAQLGDCPERRRRIRPGCRKQRRARYAGNHLRRLTSTAMPAETELRAAFAPGAVNARLRKPTNIIGEIATRSMRRVAPFDARPQVV